MTFSALLLCLCFLLPPVAVAIHRLPIHNQSLLWGTYRPNLYFGTRTRTPNTLMTGLMWFGLSDYSGFQRIRHSCEQDDKFAGYGYDKHDGRKFAIQSLNDTANNLHITTQYVKRLGGEYGGEWALRVKGEALDKDRPTLVSFMFYAGIEGDEGSLQLKSKTSANGLDSSHITVVGESPELGKFSIHVLDSPKNKYPSRSVDSPIDQSKTQFLGLNMPKDTVWQVKDRIQNAITQRAKTLVEEESNPPPPAHVLGLPNRIQDESNMFAFQKAMTVPFEFDVIFISESAQSGKSHSDAATKFSKELKNMIDLHSNQFDQRFDKVFQLTEKGFSEDQINFAKSILSHSLGGIGYFYGNYLVDRNPVDEEELFEELYYFDEDKYDEDEWEQILAERKTKKKQEVETAGPVELFCRVPSRSFFPRGFFWDEGFHQLIIAQWDNDLSLEIIQSWYNLIDANGWIAREQILGDEARSKVPPEFVVQQPHIANPPSLLLAIKDYVDRFTATQQSDLHKNMEGNAFGGNIGITEDPEVMTKQYILDEKLAKEYLEALWPSLLKNYQWFKNTQYGYLAEYKRKGSGEESYRWRGRTVNHTFASGLDDYPRANPPHVGELHIDLLSWMGLQADILSYIARFLGKPEAEELRENYLAVKENVNNLHWDDTENCYADLTVNDRDRSIFSTHKGYVSLYPFFMGLVDAKDQKLEHVLNLIYNPDELWSEFGIRSLSKRHELYGTGEDYWKGPIWINMNYLVLRALKKYYIPVEGPNQAKAQKIYSELRMNIINNMFRVYQETGFLWEQYNDRTGDGQRSHPFTGWSSLVLLIMSEMY